MQGKNVWVSSDSLVWTELFKKGVEFLLCWFCFSVILLFYKFYSIYSNKWCLLAQNLFYSGLLMNVSLRSSCIKSANTEYCNVYFAVRPWTMTSPPIILVHTKHNPEHLCYFCTIFMHIHALWDFNPYTLVISSTFHWI